MIIEAQDGVSRVCRKRGVSLWCDMRDVKVALILVIYSIAMDVGEY